MIGVVPIPLSEFLSWALSKHSTLSGLLSIYDQTDGTGLKIVHGHRMDSCLSQQSTDTYNGCQWFLGQIRTFLRSHRGAEPCTARSLKTSRQGIRAEGDSTGKPVVPERLSAMVRELYMILTFARTRLGEQ